MKIASEGVYVTNNSVYFVINKSNNGQALFKNNELLYSEMKDIFDNEQGDIKILVTDDNKLSVENTDLTTSVIQNYYSMQPKNEFVLGLEVLGNKISSKIESVDKIKKDLFDLRENKEVDFSLLKPLRELKENSGVFEYDKKSYGIAGCYVKIAKDYGYENVLLANKNFKTIIRNMSINSNGIAQEVVKEYEDSLKTKNNMSI